MEINYLSTLAPAETLLFTHGKSVSDAYLLKVTMLDLLLKQVLKITSVDRTFSQSEPSKAYHYVEVGKNFRSYQPRPHEMVFVTPFLNNHDQRIRFEQLVKIAYSKARSSAYYQTILVKNIRLHNVFSRNFFQKLIGDYAITYPGKKVEEKIFHELDYLKKTMRATTHIEQQTAVNLLAKIGGNIFLIPTITSSQLSLIAEIFQKEKERRNASNAGCSAGPSLVIANTIFDSSCSSIGGDHGTGSGCGGNGGCNSNSGSGCSSGDSGCSSGCGGCGGGGD